MRRARPRWRAPRRSARCTPSSASCPTTPRTAGCCASAPSPRRSRHWWRGRLQSCATALPLLRVHVSPGCVDAADGRPGRGKDRCGGDHPSALRHPSRPDVAAAGARALCADRAGRRSPEKIGAPSCRNSRSCATTVPRSAGAWSSGSSAAKGSRSSDSIEVDEIPGLIHMAAKGWAWARPAGRGAPSAAASVRVLPLGELTFHREVGLLQRKPRASLAGRRAVCAMPAGSSESAPGERIWKARHSVLTINAMKAD
jgi:hypothetical protein